MLTGGVLHVMIGLGVTIGAHRYFSHRSFKANFVLRCLLATMFTATGQVSAARIPKGFAVVI